MLALLPIKRCLDFSGRSGRAEFWQFVALVAVVVALAVVADIRSGRPSTFATPATVAALLSLLPLAALMVRRLHDVGRRAGWLAMGLVPVVGALWLAGWFAVDGDRGANRFGVDPKGQRRRTAVGH